MKKYPQFYLAASVLLALGLLNGCYTLSSLQQRMPRAERVVVAPAEGHVLKIIPGLTKERCNPLELSLEDKRCTFAELTPYLKDGSTLVIIFMKLYHKHITLSPIAGQVQRIHYVRGGFKNIFMKHAYEENEHNSVVIDGDISLVVVQIAGLMARRIVCDVAEGDMVERGDKLGFIKFGSAVALILPPECKVVVQEGQKVEVGRDIIATYSDIQNPVL